MKYNDDVMHIISLGAGVQSSTMALMAAHGEITPMPSYAIFADTGDEPYSVYAWLDWLEKQLPFPVLRVQKGILSHDSLKKHTAGHGKRYVNTLIPCYIKKPDGGMGPLMRKCTTDYKVKVILKSVKSCANIRRGQKNVTVNQWIGISLDESHRMKPSREPWAKNIFPLVDMEISRRACLSWMSKNGYPKPPRSACVFCPYHSDEEWLRLKTEEPKEFLRAVEYERKLQRLVMEHDEVLHGIPFLNKRGISLSDINFQDKQNANQIDLFGNECEGMCGV